ncbi:MAG: acetylglutamate kinase, partial [Myxococcota bacterium]|nr:acetylglutamate kinase [Myxococcota bacterium]
DGAEAARVRAPELQTWIDTGVVAGGMIPKAEACLSALRGGVEAVTVADGRVPHALLIELLTDAGVGTQVLPATEPPC